MINIDEFNNRCQQMCRQDIDIVLPAADMFAEELRVIVNNSCSDRLLRHASIKVYS